MIYNCIIEYNLIKIFQEIKYSLIFAIFAIFAILLKDFIRIINLKINLKILSHFFSNQ